MNDLPNDVEERTLRITKPSLILFEELMITVKDPVVKANVWFHAEGLKEPQGVKPTEKAKAEADYIAACQEHSVIPFSWLKWKYNAGLDAFVPEASIYANPLVRVKEGHSEVRRQASIDSVLRGNRIGTFAVTSGPIDKSGNGFERLSRTWMQTLKEKGYLIGLGRLVLSQYDGGTDSGVYRGTEVNFDDSSELCGIELKIHPTMDQREADFAVNWFKTLQERYEPSGTAES